jgi:hypothetical protein
MDLLVGVWLLLFNRTVILGLKQLYFICSILEQRQEERRYDFPSILPLCLVRR